ncbi:hypothetical protein Pmani_006843 [Petrolisthes manimaculis]|uniref:Uncharacterized protein n=1 Tax=Petrolisthes manimaculis TaxID=1843537 RepID=A0AAE1Q9U3_9EUCA|nr:hypothetical protein Pmani_006843 [Petrolisthes manimaculis]
MLHIICQVGLFLCNEPKVYYHLKNRIPVQIAESESLQELVRGLSDLLVLEDRDEGSPRGTNYTSVTSAGYGAWHIYRSRLGTSFCLPL